MKLYDLLWCVAETVSKGMETEWLYQYFLHTSEDHEGCIKTAPVWSDAQIADKDVQDLDKYWLFFNFKFDGEITSFVLDDNGETIIKMILFYVDDAEIDRYMDADRKLGCMLRSASKQNTYQIDRGKTVGIVSDQT